VRLELALPVHADPAHVLEGLRRGDQQGVGIDEAAAADTGAVQEERVLHERHLEDAVHAQPGLPEVLGQVPVRLREVLALPPLAHLEHCDAIALLAQPQRRDAAAEARADDHEVVVEVRHGNEVSPPRPSAG
jgi:hypothetical protein